MLKAEASRNVELRLIRLLEDACLRGKSSGTMRIDVLMS